MRNSRGLLTGKCISPGVKLNREGVCLQTHRTGVPASQLHWITRTKNHIDGLIAFGLLRMQREKNGVVHVQTTT